MNWSGMRVAAADSSVLKWANVVAFVLTVFVNGVAGGSRVIGGRLTSEVSDAFPTLVTPAGYVFSIWGLIYVLLGVFVVFQVLPSQRGKRYHERVGWFFVLSSLLNVVWLFLWQFEYLALSVVVMFLLLASLIAIYLRLGVGRSVAPLHERLAVHLPFSVYLGWITIATIADVSATLVSVGWDGFGVAQETWAALIIVVALVISLLVVATRRDVAYGLVIIWALVGIAVKQSGVSTVVMFSQAGAIVVAIALAASVLVSRLAHK